MPFAWTFPGGKRITKTIAATAGNVVTNLSPGSGKRWLVLRGTISLDTDATAATRIPRLEVTDGTNITEALTYGANVIADKIGHLEFGEIRLVHGVNPGKRVDDTNDYVGIEPILLEGSDQLRITIENGVAGDSYEGFVVVLEIDI